MPGRVVRGGGGKNSSGSRIWSRGRPRIFFRDFADVAKQSPVSKANNIIFQYKRIWEF